MYLSHDITPHPDGERLAVEAVKRGQRLACSVRDEGAWDVHRITGDLSRDELVALAVALAAMVPLDRTPGDLLAWMDEPAFAGGHSFPTLHWSDTSLRLAHKEYNGGRRDEWAREGERIYRSGRDRSKKVAS